MTSGRKSSHSGLTLVELVVVIVIIGVLVVAGSMMISKLAPSYVVGVNGQQAVGAPENALWQLRRDFEKMQAPGVSTTQTSCTLNIYTSSGSTVTYTYASHQINRGGVMLINNVTTAATCPYTLTVGSGSTPSMLTVDFSYAVGASTSAVSVPVKTTLYSYVAGPDVTSVSLACGKQGAALSETVSGTSLTGATSVYFGSDSGTLGAITATTIAVTVTGTATGWASVIAATPEGKSTLKTAFRFISLDSYTAALAGGDTRIITGAGFTSATDVTFGGTSATTYTVDSDTQITVTTPPHAAGAVDVAIVGITPTCTLTGVFTYI